MTESISSKITSLNQTTLESFNQKDVVEIVKNFTETAIKILEADFGFSWWKVNNSDFYDLVYTSPNTPYTPNSPRERGGNYEALKNKLPFFVSTVKSEDYEPQYDVSSYMKSYVIIPICYKNDVYGSITLCFINKHEFSEEERGLCNAIGNAAAQSITISYLIKNEQQARIAAEQQESRFRALIENSYDAIALIDGQGIILDLSPSAGRITGYDILGLLGKNFFELVHLDDILATQEHIKKTLEEPNEPKTVEFRYRHENGSWRWMEAVGVNMLEDPSVSSIVLNIRDVTERKESEQTIRHQAFHDTLTNLPNRQEMALRLDQSLEIAKRNNTSLAVMFVDMDRFKNYNDNLGHAAGDTVLKVTAARIQASLRAEDTVSRFGGDEFVILITEINSSKDAVVVAEKILKAVTLPIKIGDHSLTPSISIGIAIYPEDGVDRDALKKHADIALYRAKDSGRNRYQLFDNSMESYATERFVLESELRQALAYNQIVLYYQPIINLKRKNLISVEALARWQHPDRGLLLPGEFIPLAEEIGLVGELGKYVLELACKQIKIWQDLSMPKFRVAVNVSPQQFTDPDFAVYISKVLREFGIDASSLDLEITESMAMENLELAGQNLKSLKKLGVHISIDDFGTGYSSLNYLKRFPVNNLKIDKSFVRHSMTNDQDAGIVRTIISMAKNLNLKVTAEGVETDQQLNFLESLGCNAAQGFYIAQPMPPEDLPVWLEKRKAKKV